MATVTIITLMPGVFALICLSLSGMSEAAKYDERKMMDISHDWDWYWYRYGRTILPSTSGSRADGSVPPMWSHGRFPSDTNSGLPGRFGSETGGGFGRGIPIRNDGRIPYGGDFGGILSDVGSGSSDNVTGSNGGVLDTVTNGMGSNGDNGGPLDGTVPTNGGLVSQGGTGKVTHGGGVRGPVNNIPGAGTSGPVNPIPRDNMTGPTSGPVFPGSGRDMYGPSFYFLGYETPYNGHSGYGTPYYRHSGSSDRPGGHYYKHLGDTLGNYDTYNDRWRYDRRNYRNQERDGRWRYNEDDDTRGWRYGGSDGRWRYGVRDDRWRYGLRDDRWRYDGRYDRWRYDGHDDRWGYNGRDDRWVYDRRNDRWVYVRGRMDGGTDMDPSRVSERRIPRVDNSSVPMFPTRYNYTDNRYSGPIPRPYRMPRPYWHNGHRYNQYNGLRSYRHNARPYSDDRWRYGLRDDRWRYGLHDNRWRYEERDDRWRYDGRGDRWRYDGRGDRWRYDGRGDRWVYDRRNDRWVYVRGRMDGGTDMDPSRVSERRIPRVDNSSVPMFPTRYNYTDNRYNRPIPYLYRTTYWYNSRRYNRYGGPGFYRYNARPYRDDLWRYGIRDGRRYDRPYNRNQERDGRWRYDGDDDNEDWRYGEGADRWRYGMRDNRWRYRMGDNRWRYRVGDNRWRYSTRDGSNGRWWNDRYASNRRRYYRRRSRNQDRDDRRFDRDDDENGRRYLGSDDGWRYGVGGDRYRYWPSGNSWRYGVGGDRWRYRVRGDRWRYRPSDNSWRYGVGGDRWRYRVRDDRYRYWTSDNSWSYRAGRMDGTTPNGPSRVSERRIPRVNNASLPMFPDRYNYTDNQYNRPYRAPGPYWYNGRRYNRYNRPRSYRYNGDPRFYRYNIPRSYRNYGSRFPRYNNLRSPFYYNNPRPYRYNDRYSYDYFDSKYSDDEDRKNNGYHFMARRAAFPVSHANKHRTIRSYDDSESFGHYDIRPYRSYNRPYRSYNRPYRSYNRPYRFYNPGSYHASDYQNGGTPHDYKEPRSHVDYDRRPYGDSGSSSYDHYSPRSYRHHNSYSYNEPHRHNGQRSYTYNHPTPPGNVYRYNGPRSYQEYDGRSDQYTDPRLSTSYDPKSNGYNGPRMYREPGSNVDGYNIDRSYDTYDPGYYGNSYNNRRRAVAFYGTRKTDQEFPVTAPVIYDRDVTNIGGAYDYRSGYFSAPVSGIYMVNYHGQGRQNYSFPISLDLLMNNRVVNSATSTGMSGTVSNSAALFLHRYDTLAVQAQAGTALACGSGKQYCTFSVVLVRRGGLYDHNFRKHYNDYRYHYYKSNA